MIRANRAILMVSAAALLVIAFAVPAAAVGPQTQPATVLSEGFESTASASYPVILPFNDFTNHFGTSYWGPWSTRARTGSYSLWCDGISPSLGSYAVGTGGNALFDLSALADYYSSTLSFHYTLPSRGTADLNAFVVGWFTQETSSNPVADTSFALTGAGAWVSRTYDLAQGSKVSLARRAGTADFKFIDQTGDNPAPSTGEGPSIDDVLVTGWKYGPVRSLESTLATSSVRLDWIRPQRSAVDVSPEERLLSYRVWRCPVGTQDWTELTVSPLGDSATSYSSPIAGEGIQYRYAVQPWEPAAGSGYGQPSEVQVSVPVRPPSIQIDSPAQGFGIGMLPVAISGRSSDVGTGVDSVQVRIRRTDGNYWNGSLWTPTETWMSAEPSDTAWANWSFSWQPDLSVLGQQVTVSSRARDKASNYSPVPQILSAPAGVASLTLADGAAYVSSTAVTATVSVAGAAWMRSTIDSGAPGGYGPYAETTSVVLPATDGSHTVTFEFSSDGVSPFATATATAVLDLTGPSVALAVPGDGFALAAGTQLISGTSTDTVSGIESTSVRITRSGRYWNGFGWQAAPYSIVASPAAAWSLSWSPSAADMAGYDPVTIEVSARNGAGFDSLPVTVTSFDPLEPAQLAVLGQSGTLARYGQAVTFSAVLSGPATGRLALKPVRLAVYDYYLKTWTYVQGVTGADGSVAFSRIPANKSAFRIDFFGDAQFEPVSSAIYVVTPRASLGTIASPTTMYRGRTYSVWGLLRPRHRAGTYPVRIYRERYVSGRWTRYPGWINARAYDAYSYRAYDYRSATKYVAAVRMPYRGRWRLRAYHPADAGHPSVWSSRYTYVSVR